MGNDLLFSTFYQKRHLGKPFQSVDNLYGYTTSVSCSFNGKEKDYESGFHYYGARYYWSEVLTGWLSVDPMADKYPSISPYNYCMWNPIKLVDPNGMDTIISFACNTGNNITDTKNKRLQQKIRNIGDNPYLLAIAMHGNPKEVQMAYSNGSSVKPFSAKNLAERIIYMGDGQSLYIDNLNKNKPTIVVLYSCRTGYGDNCFGQQLSRELESSIVIAPEGFVWAGKNKEGRTTIENAMGIPTGLRNRPYIKGLRCNWSVFYKGKRVMSFNYSAPQAWIKKQGGVDKVIDKVIKQYEK